MPTTIDYPGYRRSDIAAGLHPVEGKWGEGGSTRVGLSGFDIPQTIHFQVTPTQQVRIVFNYSDHEAAERESYSIPGRPSIELYLGEHTRKIIEIRIDDLEGFLADYDAQLGLEDLGFIADRFSSKQQRVFRQNAELINQLLGKLPSRFWKDLRKTASR